MHGDRIGGRTGSGGEPHRHTHPRGAAAVGLRADQRAGQTRTVRAGQAGCQPVGVGLPMRALPRLRDFVTSEAGRPALLGCLGAVLITAGGLGAGSTRLHDPVLETARLSWLRFGHGLVFSSVLLWLGVALMLFAWLWLGRRAIAGATTEFTMIATTGF